MAQATSAFPSLKFLQDRWDPALAATLDEPELLRYRSNLLGSDLRITNFAGGNTSSKIAEIDPLTGAPVEVLWVKGSGGDLGSIRRAGFATLYQQKFVALEDRYQGIDGEDDMVAMYLSAAFRDNPVAASIDTPLHGFLPFLHVDHLHPDWGIALAASANGKSKMDEFNREFGRSLVWMPWLRPGFELGLRMRRVVAENPACDGIVLGGHGLFTWGESPYACYRNTLTVIDQIGQFIERHGIHKGLTRFGGKAIPARPDRQQLALEIAPCLRGRVSAQKRYIASFSDAPDVLQFVNSAQGRELAFLGTSCPDHFIRTKIRPLYIPWAAGAGLAALKEQIGSSLDEYREQYRAYYHSFATPDSPALRDTSPTVVLIPGLGMFSFGKNKTEARIVGEFYTNAIHVIEGATLLAEGEVKGTLPQCGEDLDPASFKVCSNYVALPAIEAFRIEYWAMEDAKLRRQPPEKELSRRIALVVGDGSPASEAALKAAALDAAARGAHVVVASPDQAAAVHIAEELKSVTSPEFVATVAVDLSSRESIVQALRATVQAFGGLDMLIDTAAAPSQLLVAEAATLFAEQGLEGSVVLNSTSPALYQGTTSVVP
ncbi:MAG: bifunctional rhamnulose-1-phosphate aldolase/short-chain dehydrogenase [Terracidiphilus sp.]